MPYVAIVTAMFLWASTFVVLKALFVVFDPFFVLFARMLIATLSLCVLLVARRGVKCHYHQGDWKWFLLMGLTEPCLYFLFEAKALSFTSASQAGMVTIAMPFLAGLGAQFFLHEKLALHKWQGLVISSIGIIALTWLGKADSHAPNPVLGNLLELLAMCCSSAFILIVKRLSSRYSPLVIIGVSAVMGCVWFGSALLMKPDAWPTHFPLMQMLLVVYLGAGVTLGAYGLHIWAVTRVPVVVATSFNNLIPVITLFIAWAALGERLNSGQWLACIVVFVGLLWSQRPVKTPSRHAGEGAAPRLD